MAKGKVGRPSKLDKDTMKEANISFIIIIIILLILLSVATLTVINPEIYNALKASIININKKKKDFYCPFYFASIYIEESKLCSPSSLDNSVFVSIKK